MKSVRDLNRGRAGVWAWRMGSVFVGGAMMLSLATASGETLYGKALMLHDGSARTYVVMENGVPSEVGVEMDRAFVAAVPAHGAHGGVLMPDGRSTFEYVLEMPAGNPGPFQHVTLDWNPLGHQPEGVYDKAHFDVHFYTIGLEERRAIDPADPAFMEKASRLPAQEFIPAGYVNPDLPPVPMMGLHLVHMDAPELRAHHPEPFLQTFLYGTWDGRLIFVEPMISMELLSGEPDSTFAVPLAERYDPQGYYPAAYSVRWDAAEAKYRIALNDLQWR